MLIGSYLPATCPPVLAVGGVGSSPCSSFPHLAFVHLSDSFRLPLEDLLQSTCVQNSSRLDPELLSPILYNVKKANPTA